MELTWCIALLMMVANTQRADKQVGAAVRAFLKSTLCWPRIG